MHYNIAIEMIQDVVERKDADTSKRRLWMATKRNWRSSKNTNNEKRPAVREQIAGHGCGEDECGGSSGIAIDNVYRLA